MFAVERSSLLTWKWSFVEFYNWFGAISAFDGNFFATSVLFNLLLELENSDYTHLQDHINLDDSKKRNN